MAIKKRFETEVDPELLARAIELAKAEGREVDSLIEEALIDLLGRRSDGGLRPEVREAYGESVSEFGPLYKRLAQ